ncbi:hypothetical protein SAMN02745247_02829 [Butyrivibrio hungatei DSM 14810]|uniref:Uncharacterized protein n=1 Tax=Butyrivibrio hungatei DSM 14810 TaxID=1121132 RepID=A0A1M7T1H1_9FIRM|nr:hypothetical protein [Butyrivibrio hungatei]SHN64635.1 hypothetical protein SAMN02745247_02829 [Butyrivibrio hungatei DSM 14810]
MQIEIAEAGRMTQSGSSLLRLIQNNNMPALDLLVRESIQNSLDARKNDSRYVEVDYLTGKFNSQKLGEELEEITDSLNQRYGKKEYDYIAIRDSNTVGLTGVMDYKHIQNNAYGNLLKLVYEICKPQEAEGAGGSWGIGKTVYFRIGIGLVIYYSRIVNEEGEFESRLAASLVENELDPNAMIPVYDGMIKRGIAWWGDKTGTNSTQPVTDEGYIKKFLKIFGVEEYKDDETGTTIIIPYINTEELLRNNRTEYTNDQEQEVIPFWGTDIEQYLSIAVQRWYAPRLNNKTYQQGAYLRTRINGKGIALDSMEPVFQVVQSLYNRAQYVNEEDILTDLYLNKEVIVKDIKVKNTLEDTKIGTLAFVKVTRDLLKMNVPDNKPEPYMFFNNEIRDTEVNKPTICFTRKPAMIVSYENVGPWVSNIPPSGKDEYIIGIFVLSSFNKLKNSPTPGTIEEYIRKSEMADHTSWGDWSEGNYNPRFVFKIQNNIIKTVSSEYSSKPENHKPIVNSGLSKLFGDMLLPPEGGTLPGPDPDPVNPPNPKDIKRSRFRFAVEAKGIKYLSDRMIIPMVLETSAKRKISRTGFDVLIDSESKKIDINEWENKMKMETPFTISDFRIQIDNLNGEKISTEEQFSDSDSIEVENIVFAKKISKNGTCHGLSIFAEEPQFIKAKIYVTVNLKRRDIKPSFVFEKESE